MTLTPETESRFTVGPDAALRVFTVTAADAPPPAADRRVNELLDLIQALFTALGDVSTDFSAAIQDPERRRRVLAHAEENDRLCRSRLNKILNNGA